MTFPFRPSSLVIAVERTKPPAAATWRKPTATFVLMFALVWLLLYGAYVSLPFVRPGSTIISEAKFDGLVASNMYGPHDRARVMVFGNSKVLSGVRPLELDTASGRNIRSYNLGLPGEVRFLPILEGALRAGNVPTHVLLTIAWDDRPVEPGLLAALRDDVTIGNSLFPFRSLPRDLVLFGYNNRSRLIEGTHDAARQREKMLEQRGWYFIKSQSHYSDDRLPDEYALPTDRPSQRNVRKIPAQSASRERLEKLAVQYGFQILLVPSASRKGEFAPPSAEDHNRLQTISDRPLIRVLGPDYWVYPQSYFADPIHLNPRGASAYTTDLAGLLEANRVFD